MCNVNESQGHNKVQYRFTKYKQHARPSKLSPEENYGSPFQRMQQNSKQGNSCLISSLRLL